MAVVSAPLNHPLEKLGEKSVSTTNKEAVAEHKEQKHKHVDQYGGQGALSGNRTWPQNAELSSYNRLHEG